jgi:nucleotide-binding universal stress UspA family protein
MANILVPFDFSVNATTALDQACLVAIKKRLSIEVLHIVNFKTASEYPVNWGVDPHSPDLHMIRKKLNEHVDERKRTCCAVEVPIEISVKESVMVNGGIINHMLHKKSDLIMMGTHGTTNAIERFWGTNSSTMINHSLFPVMVVPPQWKPATFNEMIAAVALKEISECLPQVTKWTEWLHVAPTLVTMSSVPEVDKPLLEEAVKGYEGVKAVMVDKKNDMPLWKNLVAFTENRNDTLLLMFVHERTVLEKLFDYSITSKVAERIHIPLLALPAKHK